ncbi:hypothetical protein [Bradyrhizobium pachyrhizi]|uniref:hypothetical protein n=1 Tax=Bradyrhizobium pachyrhizi TaxID=280333 RepID=UPI003D15F635
MRNAWTSLNNEERLKPWRVPSEPAANPWCATSLIDGSSAQNHGQKAETYQTSLGFFDLAIAAPSMKAALEAWGADSNLFRQGAAKESDDPDVIAATMAKPGVVLRRPGRHAELPTDLEGGRPTKAARKSKGSKAKKPSSRPVDKAAQRQAALDYEREEKAPRAGTSKRGGGQAEGTRTPSAGGR